MVALDFTIRIPKLAMLVSQLLVQAAARLGLHSLPQWMPKQRQGDKEFEANGRNKDTATRISTYRLHLSRFYVKRRQVHA